MLPAKNRISPGSKSRENTYVNEIEVYRVRGARGGEGYGRGGGEQRVHQIEEYEEVGGGGRIRVEAMDTVARKGGERRGEVGLFSMVSKPRSNCAYRSVLLSRQRSHCPLPLLR